jgi:hypothetical protein
MKIQALNPNSCTIRIIFFFSSIFSNRTLLQLPPPDRRRHAQAIALVNASAGFPLIVQLAITGEVRLQPSRAFGPVVSAEFWPSSSMQPEQPS